MTPAVITEQYSLGYCEHVQYTTDVKYVQQTTENVHEYQVYLLLIYRESRVDTQFGTVWVIRY